MQVGDTIQVMETADTEEGCGCHGEWHWFPCRYSSPRPDECACVGVLVGARDSRCSVHALNV